MVRDDSGNLYGTTLLGGDTNCQSGAGEGCGIAYELSPNGSGGAGTVFEITAQNHARH